MSKSESKAAAALVKTEFKRLLKLGIKVEDKVKYSRKSTIIENGIPFAVDYFRGERREEGYARPLAFLIKSQRTGKFVLNSTKATLESLDKNGDDIYFLPVMMMFATKAQIGRSLFLFASKNKISTSNTIENIASDLYNFFSAELKKGGLSAAEANEVMTLKTFSESIVQVASMLVKSEKTKVFLDTNILKSVATAVLAIRDPFGSSTIVGSEDAIKMLPGSKGDSVNGINLRELYQSSLSNVRTKTFIEKFTKQVEDVSLGDVGGSVLISVGPGLKSVKATAKIDGSVKVGIRTTTRKDGDLKHVVFQLGSNSNYYVSAGIDDVATVVEQLEPIYSGTRSNYNKVSLSSSRKPSKLRMLQVVRMLLK